MVMGIGAMGLGIVEVLRKFPEFEVVAVVDKDPNALIRASKVIAKNVLVTLNAEEALNARPDVLIDATTSIVESALFLLKALEAGIHVVLMNSEVDQVFGRVLAETARKNNVVLTSDAGDQYGVLSRLIDDVRMMGFQIVMAGNNKGFLDRYATPESINHEAEIRRLSNKQCTAYTDGTKLAIEMAIIGNAENLSLLGKSMAGPKVADVHDALIAFDLDKAREMGGVVDYVLGARPGGSVFVIGYSEDPEDRFYMNYYKMGNGPYYLFLRPYHLCHFETPFTLRKLFRYKEPVLVQERRILEVNAYAKTNLQAGTKLDGIGGYHLYGLLEKPSGLPIGLSEGVVLTRNKKKDEPIKWDDIEFQKNDLALALWEKQEKKTQIKH
jgi:predicted homoserine dehydrogenase-like protein